MGIARSGIGWLLAKFATLGLSFLATMYFARVLADPTTTLGTFQVFEMVASFAILLINPGMGSALVKRVSEGESRQEIVASGLVVLAGFTVVGTVVLLLARRYLADAFGLSAPAIFLLVGLLWAIQGREFASAVISGSSRVGRAGLVDLVDILVRVVIQVSLIAAGFEVLGLMGGAVVGTAVAAVVAFRMMPVSLDGRASVDGVKRLASFARYSFFGNIASKTYQNVDTAVIAFFLGNSAVGLYNVPFRVALVLAVVSGAIGRSALPELSKHATAGEDEEVRRILADAVVFSTIVALPATVGMALLAEPIIVTLFTPAFAEGATVAVLAVAIQVPEGPRSVLSSAADGLDRPDLSLRSDGVLIGANVLLDVLLVPRMGIEGAAVATLVSITLAVIYLAWTLVTELDLSWRVFEVRLIGAELVAAGIMGAVVFGLRESLRLRPIPEMVLLILVGVVVYWTVLPALSRDIRERLLLIARSVLPEW